MRTFTDNEGREWRLELTIGSVKRVRDLVQVNLLELDKREKDEEPLLTRLGTDIVLVCDVIYALVKPQADERNISDEQFGAALGGDVIARAFRALYQELVDFFQTVGRGHLAKAVEVQDRLIHLANEQAESRIAEIDLKKLASASGRGSTNSRERAASTRTR